MHLLRPDQDIRCPVQSLFPLFFFEIRCLTKPEVRLMARKSSEPLVSDLQNTEVIGRNNQAQFICLFVCLWMMEIQTQLK